MFFEPKSLWDLHLQLLHQLPSTDQSIREKQEIYAHGLADEPEDTFSSPIDNLGLLFGPMIGPQDDIPISTVPEVLIALVVLAPSCPGHRDGGPITVRNGQRAGSVEPYTLDLRWVDFRFGKDLL